MDNVGNRTRTTYADGDYIDYTYDELYRLTDETRTGATSYSQQFSYDAVGNRVQLVKSGQGGGQTINYTYNAGDQLLQAQDLAGPTTSYAYDDNGNMTQTAVGAQTAYYYYDFDNRLVSINRDNLFFADAGDLADETTRSHRRLAYGSSSARSAAFTKRQFLLRPDSPDSLIKAAFWVWTSGFGLLILAIVLCELPLLLYRLKYCRQRFDCVSAWPKRYSFFKRCLICLLLAFSFVLLNPETEVAYALPTSQAKYTYAPDGARIEKDVDGTITKFIYDGENAVAEYDNTNPPQMNLLATYVTPSTDFNISKTDTTGTYFYTHDGLGSVRQLLDASETIQNDYDYNAFGESLSETELVTNDFKYTGRRFDTESGIYYYRARYYDTAVGRFLQKDPLLVVHVGLDVYLAVAGSNLAAIEVLKPFVFAHSYVNNNPVSFADPLGLLISITIGAGLSLYMRVADILSALRQIARIVFAVFAGVIRWNLPMRTNWHKACLRHGQTHAIDCADQLPFKNSICKTAYIAAAKRLFKSECWALFWICLVTGSHPWGENPFGAKRHPDGRLVHECPSISIA